jgi:hypothetical protein
MQTVGRERIAWCLKCDYWSAKGESDESGDGASELRSRQLRLFE